MDQPDTYYAPAERATEEELREEIRVATQNPIVNGLLNCASGLLAVLNEKRQILTLNGPLLNMLKIDDPYEILGLRPGEAMNCVHSTEMPGGCGTSKFCASCGAAIAIVTSLAKDKPIERNCNLKTVKNGKTDELFLRVTSSPVSFDGRRFLLLFMNDMTYYQKWAALDKLFFHDVSNLTSTIVCATDILSEAALPQNVQTIAEDLRHAATHLAREINLHKCMSSDKAYTECMPIMGMHPCKEIIEELGHLTKKHPSADGKTIVFDNTNGDIEIHTDVFILTRVLNNMAINALEATPKGGKVRVYLEIIEPDKVAFCVWNDHVMEDAVREGIFEKNFSTKDEFGRGIGTYSMKLFGENFLKGSVTFESAEGTGTIFRITLRR